MNKVSNLLFTYAVGIPLALALGFLVAMPGTITAATLAAVVCCALLPLAVKWHRPLLVFTWNSAFILGFLPGQPKLCLIFAAFGFSIGLLNLVLGFKSFVRAPELTKPLVLLLAVILVTAFLRGGIGSKIFGTAAYGGRNYAFVLAAFIGYFAMTAQRIPQGKGPRMVKWFFLGGTTNALSNFIYLFGPSFYFLYYLVRVGSAAGQAQSDMDSAVVNRLGDFGSSSIFLLCFALARWGVRGFMAWNKPWRPLLLATAVAGVLMSGFRSQVVFLVALLAVQFFLEGLWRTALLPVICLLGGLCLASVIFFADKLPPAVQRSLAFLPVNINPDIRADARYSIDWRLGMWNEVLTDVPKYLVLGKGYSIDPLELNMTEAAAQFGLLNGYEVSITAGDYHNGPLSVLMPFGLMGAVAFIWLLGAGLKVLYGNYRYGDARLKLANTTLFAYFMLHCFFFFFVVGAFNYELMTFLGTLGFSVSLNNGVCRREAAKLVPLAQTTAMALEPA